jgi:uncharacterized phage protein gp47/JayE
MTYGLTTSGFIMKRGADILGDLKTNLSTIYPLVNLNDDTVTVQILGIIAKELASLWEVSNAVYNSTYPNSAEGVMLDYVCELNAITRLGATNTQAIIGAKGIDGTIVLSQFFQCQNAAKTITFAPASDFTISNQNTVQCTFNVSNVQDNAVYSVTVNNHIASINSGTGATAISIAEQLYNEINILTDILEVSASLPTTPNGHFMIVSNDGKSGFLAIITSNLTMIDFYTPFVAYAVDTGALSANAGTITYILTPVAGLDSIYNFIDAITGNDIETDTDLRIRRADNIRTVGACTIESMRARILQDVNNVKQCLVYENDKDIVDLEGRPPHSVEVLVDGGIDQDIANEIWQIKGGGIQTYGNQSYTITDSMGIQRLIYFSRPTPQYIWLQLTLDINDSFPISGTETISNNLVNFAENEFNIGDEILIQALYGSIYSVSGITNSIILIGVSNDILTPPVTWVNTNIVLDEREVSDWDISRISYTLI